MPNYIWKRIEPLSDEDKNIDLAAISPLYDTWKIAKQRLKKSSPTSLELFTQRLIRRLSIETGILERLYDIDRGTTEALVADGFAEELVSRSSTDIDPSRLIDILRDQEAAIQLVMDCVAGERSLSKTVIHELHAILTQHQDMTTAIDQFGTRFEIHLQKGRFKDQPNNPKRPDGSIHEYCPPIHVESEMERLLAWLSEYRDEDPIITASWLHHRFTQIHPYQDGNGRVGRAITTLVLLRSGLLPLVIDRDLRTEYVQALEAADRGQLRGLAILFARLQRAAILQALSVDADVEVTQERRLTSAVIASLTAKFKRRREDKDAELRKVNDLAKRLRGRTRTVLEETLSKLKGAISQLAEPQIHIAEGGPDRQNAHWYKFEVVLSATLEGKLSGGKDLRRTQPLSITQVPPYVNFEEDHYFIKASMRVDRERLIFITSFHHVGRELSGLMEATAFARLQSYEQSEDRDQVSQDFFLCSLEPFVVTYRTKEEEIEAAFDNWLDAAIAVAIKEYGDRL